MGRRSGAWVCLRACWLIFRCFNAHVFKLKSREIYVPAGKRTALCQSQCWQFCQIHVCFKIWRSEVSDNLLTRSRFMQHADTRTQAATARFLAQHIIARVSCCCWSLGPSSSRYQSLSYSSLCFLTLLIENGCDWERERAEQTERGRMDSCVNAKESKNKSMSEWKEQRARPVQASAGRMKAEPPPSSTTSSLAMCQTETRTM